MEDGSGLGQSNVHSVSYWDLDWTKKIEFKQELKNDFEFFLHIGF